MEFKITVDDAWVNAFMERLEERIAARIEARYAANTRPEPEPETRAEQANHTPAPEPAKPEAPTVTRDDVQRVAIEAVRAGKRDGLKNLLAGFGASRVSEIQDDKLADFMNAVAGL